MASASMIDGGQGGQGVAVPKVRREMSVATITFHVVGWVRIHKVGHIRCEAC